jgi:acyl-CoA thioesterase I
MIVLAGVAPMATAQSQLGAEPQLQNQGDGRGAPPTSPAPAGAPRTEQEPLDLKPADLSGIPALYTKDCAVKAPVHDGRIALRYVRRALKAGRSLKVLAIGSSSTVGVGASTPKASYPVRLESDLETFLPGFNVEMFVRGVNGEVADQAAERLKIEVADVKPDLVVWQVGTNDALSRADEQEFGERLGAALDWLAKHKIDVVLIDPQYVDQMADDSHYLGIVGKIAEVARFRRVLLVHRFDAMADLARQSGDATYLAPDKLHLNDLGYRCMAEYAARTIVAGILQAEREVKPQN